MVYVQLEHNTFAFGAATNSAWFGDSIDTNLKTYRDTLLKYFNKV